MWICTIDCWDTVHLADDEINPVPSRVGWTSFDFVKGTPLPYHWRTLDADGIVYHAGLADRNETEEEAFAPLDDLSRPDAGAISIEWFDWIEGKWVPV